MHLQPSEFERLPFYEIEYMMEHMKEDNEEEKKRHKEEEDKYKSESMDMKSMQKDMDNMKRTMTKNTGMGSTPKFPDLSNFKL